MIINGWVDWAIRIDGVPDKVYTQKNTGEWITCHSVVGEESEFQDGVPNRFLSTDKDSSGRYTDPAAASCMFILRKNGTLIQMYPIWASTWTSGGREANTRSWAIEAEGGLNPYSEPLTSQAKNSFVRLVREWEAHTGRKGMPNETLLQHSQVAKMFGYSPTACASGRYSEAWDLCLQSNEDDMYKEKYEELTAAIEKRMAILALASDLNRYDEMLNEGDLVIEGPRQRKNCQNLFVSDKEAYTADNQKKLDLDIFNF
jgi:hypothetical protein